mmetsp:Transcript_153014/g.265995  ORF Transcript_153014/g.265995 Transcript_153014/m.265995 type:complete len:285 (-) Transcript_153014:264-1118(-)
MAAHSLELAPLLKAAVTAFKAISGMTAGWAAATGASGAPFAVLGAVAAVEDLAGAALDSAVVSEAAAFDCAASPGGAASATGTAGALLAVVAASDATASPEPGAAVAPAPAVVDTAGTGACGGGAAFAAAGALVEPGSLFEAIAGNPNLCLHLRSASSKSWMENSLLWNLTAFLSSLHSPFFHTQSNFFSAESQLGHLPARLFTINATLPGVIFDQYAWHLARARRKFSGESVTWSFSFLPTLSLNSRNFLSASIIESHSWSMYCTRVSASRSKNFFHMLLHCS